MDIEQVIWKVTNDGTLIDAKLIAKVIRCYFLAHILKLTKTTGKNLEDFSIEQDDFNNGYNQCLKDIVSILELDKGNFNLPSPEREQMKV